jgi:tRNA(fMet)-specific endonuclease VapC
MIKLGSIGYLADTGIANHIAFEGVIMLQRVASFYPLLIPVFSVAELQYGGYLYAHKHQSTRYLDIYERFVEANKHNVLSPDVDTATYYAPIYAELKAKGQLIQQNDVWIAALAIQYRLTLLTRDKDYERISGLRMQLF